MIAGLLLTAAVLFKDSFCLKEPLFITISSFWERCREIKEDEINTVGSTVRSGRGIGSKNKTVKAGVIERNKDFIATALFTKASAYCTALWARLQRKHKVAKSESERNTDF